jgi:carbamoyl-phosphate synthase large subunit
MTTVLVTGVGGGGNGEQLVKALRLSSIPCRVVGTDLTVPAAKQSGADHFEALPRANDPGYLDALLDVCARQKVDVLLPGSEPELRLMARHATRIRERVALLAVNDLALIDVCSDKFKTAKFLAAHGFDSPASWLVASVDELASIPRFPLIVKPTVGGGSQNVYLIQNRDELQMICGFLLGYYDSVLVQEYVGRVDQEFTVGVLFDGEGKLINSIALNRFILTSLSNRIRVPNRTDRKDLGEVLAISSGVSQGRIDAFAEVREHSERVGLALGAKYAINVQCRLVDGRPMIFEINPRFSGTSSIRAMLGFNEPDLLIRKHLLGETLPERPGYRYGTVLRGLREIEVPAS